MYLGTRTLKIEIDGEQRAAEVTKCRIRSAAGDSGVVTFADAAAGGKRLHTLEFTAMQDPADADSIWNLVWASAGSTVTVEIDPYGGGEPSLANPMFTGSVIVAEPDGDLLGGDANPSSTARWTMDLKWEFTAKPTKVTAA